MHDISISYKHNNNLMNLSALCLDVNISVLFWSLNQDKRILNKKVYLIKCVLFLCCTLLDFIF